MYMHLMHEIDSTLLGKNLVYAKAFYMQKLNTKILSNNICLGFQQIIQSHMIRNLSLCQCFINKADKHSYGEIHNSSQTCV